MDWINVSELVTRSPFCDIFEISEKVQNALTQSMRHEGFDESKPLDVWMDGDTFVVVDGHTRLDSAKEVGLSEVPIFVHPFEGEEDAIKYAIHNQRDRRNISDKDFARQVDAVYFRRGRGGDRRSEDFNASRDALKSTIQDTADLLGSSKRKVERTVAVLDRAEPELKKDVLNGDVSINKAYNQTREREKALDAFFAESPPHPADTLELKVVEEQPKDPPAPKFNRTNDNVEWALWTWNPVTGCLHNCAYCYARDIANRFYPQKFEPTFHADRLAAPRHMKLPAAAATNIGEKNVFVCSMADLFGKWVPREWIDAVFEEVRNAPDWNFLFLTKFPARYEELAGHIPDNAWIGTSVDKQHAVQRAEKAFRKCKDAGYKGIAWLSCEPMLERLTFSSLDMFDWVVAGGASKSTQTDEFFPPIEWTFHLWQQAQQAGAKFYMKTNLGVRHEIRIREYPGMELAAK